MGGTLLAINNYFYRRGGAEAIFLDQIDMFERAGWRSVPFSMQHPNNLETEWSSHFIPEIEFGRQSSLLTKVEHSLEVIYSRKARAQLSGLIDQIRPDIAHAHNVYHHISPSIFPLLKKRGIPTVLTAHDLKLACPAYKMLSPQGICEKCKGGRIYNVLANRCMKESVALSGLVMVETAVHRMFGLYRNYLDRIIVPSLFYKAKLIEWGWPSEQLIHVPNFVDQSITDNPAVSDEGDYFLFAGRLAPEKGIATLIRAAGLSKQRLRIAGTGPDESALRTLAQDVGADVDFLGYLTGGALHQAIAGAKALVLPSEWYENAPVSLLEAYALGRPVIGTNIGGIPELIKNGETGLIAQPLDAENLAQVLTAMNDLPTSARQEMGERGRDWVSREFSQGAYLERTTALYRELGAR